MNSQDESRTANPKLRAFLPLVISILALVTSFVALYLAHLRPARLEIAVGEQVSISRFPQRNVGLSIAVAFGNHGAQLATVTRLALVIQESGVRKGYLLEPLLYEKLDEKGESVPDSLTVPISIPPRTTIVKEIMFRSSVDRPDEFRVTKPGTYKLTLLTWITGSMTPETFGSFSIVISDQQATLLEKKPGSLVRLRQSEWSKWAARYLTEAEFDDFHR